jgi:hypothetical protein
MHINDLKPFTFDADGEIRPWIDPESVTGIDYAAWRAFYKEHWLYRELHRLYLTDEPETEIKKLYDYVSECASWWDYHKSVDEPMPEALSAVDSLALSRADVFFLRRLGFFYSDCMYNLASNHSNETLNKKIFTLYQTAFEEETEPYVKFCLQMRFLEFFGYIPAFEEGASRNWDGLSEADLQYLKDQHCHRMLVHFY